MYQITCDDLILHDVRLPKEYRVMNPVCHLEVNTAGSMSFKIAPNHPYYDRIQKLKSVITLTQDGEWIFSGRVLNDQKDFQNIKTIEVEGELSYLNDSNQLTAEYHDISVEDYFTTVIDKHNGMVDDDKKFTVGSVTVTDPNGSLYRFSNYENSWETVQDKLLDRLGGYVRIRHLGGVKYIDYVVDYENINNQQINFGKNLLDLTQYVNGEDIATAIIPLGASDPETDVRLTIESVNDGVPYVYDQDAVDLYGWIFSTVTFDDVTLAGNLKTKGLAELAKTKLLNFRLDLNAVDLHLMDVEFERIKLGDKLKVISEPHGINDYMMVSKMTINLEDPASNTISLGSTSSSLTEITNKTGVQKVIENAIIDLGVKEDVTRLKQEMTNVQSDIERTPDQIMLQVSEVYASKDELSSVNRDLTTRIEQNSSTIDFRFNSLQSETETINGIITSNQQLLEEYIRFQGALIELGKVGNAFTAKLGNDKLAFLQDNVEIAYISNNRLFITDAEIRNILSIGNDDTGFWDWIPRTNGHLSLKWRGLS